jgi:hypothetical protein
MITWTIRSDTFDLVGRAIKLDSYSSLDKIVIFHWPPTHPSRPHEISISYVPLLSERLKIPNDIGRAIGADMPVEAIIDYLGEHVTSKSLAATFQSMILVRT